MKLRYSHDDVERWRERVFRARRNGHSALRFIELAGYCFVHDSHADDLPSLEHAVLRNGGSSTNEVRKQLSFTENVYCGRVLRRRPTMLSLEFLPYFFVLSGRTGNREDHAREYARGTLSDLEHDILGRLAKGRSMDSQTLSRRVMKNTNKLNAEFQRALAGLQDRMYIARIMRHPSGGSEWTLIQKVFRREIRRAGRISIEQARFAILQRYFENRLIATVAEIVRLFGWKRQEVYETLGHLIDRGIVASGVLFENQKGIHYCLIR